MLYGLLVTLFILVCVLLVLMILIQKGKSSIGMGAFGGNNQMLFGGSGGQDVLQKATWILGSIFMAGSLVLAIMKKPRGSRYLDAIEQQQNAQEAAKAQAKLQQEIAQAAKANTESAE